MTGFTIIDCCSSTRKRLFFLEIWKVLHVIYRHYSLQHAAQTQGYHMHGYVEYMNNKKAVRVQTCISAGQQCSAVLSQQYLLLWELNFVCIKDDLFLNILKKKCVLGST